MKLRIATWNMAYWTHKGLQADSWRYFMNDIDADIFLFQEGRPTEEMLANKNHLAWNEIGGRRNWGSGIYSNKYEIQEEIIDTKFKGVFTIGSVRIENNNLTLISLYGLMESSGSSKGYSITNLHRMLSDLTGLFDGNINGRRKIVMGGDLNASTQLDEVQKNSSHKIMFDRIDDFGLKDVYKLAGNKAHIQTLRHTKSKKPWQNDYMFVNKPLVKGFAKYEIIDNEQVRKYSDHNVLVVEMSL